MPSSFHIGAALLPAMLSTVCLLALIAGTGSTAAAQPETSPFRGLTIIDAGNPSGTAAPPQPTLAKVVNPDQPTASKADGMVLIPSGEFWMGCADDGFADVRPIHKVHVDAFWMDQTEVTNEQFADFVKATGYVTIAEQKPKAEDFPGAPPENLVPGSLVFVAPPPTVKPHGYRDWWRYVHGADWRHPEGPSSDLTGREKHPVVHIAWDDAVAYAKWAGKRLPTEAEFEYAARGGLDRKLYSWGDELKPGGKWQCNIWQGRFPWKDLVEDGYHFTAPVRSFPANGYGLYDMSGNVWEWCSDWYRADCYQSLAGLALVSNPVGPADSSDPAEPGVKKRVQRGGSFLCCDEYCSRYIVGARGKGEPDSGSSHIGFRCVKGLP